MIFANMRNLSVSTIQTTIDFRYGICYRKRRVLPLTGIIYQAGSEIASPAPLKQCFPCARSFCPSFTIASLSGSG